MGSTFWVCVGTSVMLAWSCWKLRQMKARKVESEARIDDLLTISDSLNRTHRARKIAMRHASIGEIIRDIPG